MGLFGKKEEFSVKAVSAGKVKTLASLKDGVFSEKMMGDGVVIAASDSLREVEIHSPISGEVVVAFPTGHAYGIKAKNGVELLVHIGVDTVNLEGKGFTQHVKQGQKVKQGDKLATVDLDFVRKNAPTADAIVIVTSGQKIDSIAKGEVSLDSVLFEVK